MSSLITDYLQSSWGGGEWFVDHDGVLATTKHKDSVITYQTDWSGRMADGETIASATYTVDGVTLDASSETTTVTSYTISQSGGSITIAVTTSAGRTLVEPRRFYSAPEGETTSDY